MVSSAAAATHRCCPTRFRKVLRQLRNPLILAIGLTRYHQLEKLIVKARRDRYLVIDGSEAAWAQRTVLTGLNRELKIIARRNGWQYVDGHVKASAHHGYCSANPYVVSWTEAKRAQEAKWKGVGPSPGLMHPNRLGHIRTAPQSCPRSLASACRPVRHDGYRPTARP
jgi:hypothetical protein